MLNLKKLTTPRYSICKLTDAPRVAFTFDSRILFSSGRYEMIHLTLQPGEGMEPHTQPMDVAFFVIEGTGTLLADNERIAAGENTAIHVSSGVERAWTNTGTTPLRILVNKLPDAG